jgi:hypothetical protein
MTARLASVLRAPAGGPVLRRAAALALVAGGLLAARAWSANRHIETFDTTQFRDAQETTAHWDTATGRLRLHPFEPVGVGGLDTPGNAFGFDLWGSLGLVADGAAGLRIANLADPANPATFGTFATAGNALGVAASGALAVVAVDGAGIQFVGVENPASPVALGIFDTPGQAYGVAVSGTTAYVADASAGLQIVSFANPAAPVLVGALDTPGTAQAVAVSGTRAYVADGPSGLLVIDVSNPAAPALLGSLDTPGYASGVALSGTLACVADQVPGVHIVDVSAPATPLLLATFDTPGAAYGVTASGALAVVADGPLGIRVLDIHNPASPVSLSTFDTAGSAIGVVLAGGLACVADAGAGLRVVRIADGAGPRPVATHDTPYEAYGVAIAGHVAYVADGVSGLHVVDLADPSQPVLLGSVDTPGFAVDVVVEGIRAYVADGAAGLRVVDVTNPAAPVLLGAYDTPGYALRLAVSGSLVVVADGASGLQIISAANPSSPVLLGSHDTPGLAFDVAVAGTVAYVADAGSGLRIVSLANPAAPALLGTYDTPESASGVAVAWPLACVADAGSGLLHEGGLRILDVRNPASPALIGFAPLTAVGDVAVSGGTAFVTRVAYSSALGSGPGAIHAFDIRNPGAPVQRWAITAAPSARGLALAGPLLGVACDTTGLRLFDVLEHRFDLTRNVAQSVAVASGGQPVRRARVVPTQVDSVAWQLTADGGATWLDAAPGGWIVVGPGSDLRWRSTLTPTLPSLAAPPPEASNLEVEWLHRPPAITSVTDVPGDQGGQVRLRFGRSADDFAGDTLPVTGYQIHHRVDDMTLAARVRSLGAAEPPAVRGPMPGVARQLDGRRFVIGEASAGAFPPGTWEAVGWIAALQRDDYLALLPTTADSTSGGTTWSVYVVTAHTTDPATWYAGAPDSGYSIDNLAPSVPTGFVAAAQAGGHALFWDASADDDFRWFRVYRSIDPDFVPGPSTLVHESIGTSWLDAGAAGSVTYRLTATDFSGNESLPATAQVVVGVRDTAPLRFDFHPIAPNPARAGASLRFDVPAGGGTVLIGAYDVAGRLVRVLTRGPHPAGRGTVAWDGRDDEGRQVPAGLYLVRMEAPGFVRMRKLALTP